MNRSLAVALALTAAVVLAGCSATAGVTTEEPTDATTGTPTTATEATPTTDATPSATADVCESPPEPDRRSLPDPPAAPNATTAAEFAAAHEEAVAWNRMVADGFWSLAAGVTEATVVNRTGDGYVVHLELDLGWRTCVDGEVVSGTGVLRTNYFLNDTTVVRLPDPPARTTDPRGNGTVLGG